MKHLSYRTDTGEFRQVSAASFLWSGCGFGGSCFPKDVRALMANASHHGVETPLLEAVMGINDSQPLRMIDLLRASLPSLAGRRVVVLGLAFKPGTDDVRESPALPIIAELIAQGANVICHDPVAASNARAALAERGLRADTLSFHDHLPSALDDADGVLLVTSWPEYRQVPQILSALPNPPPLVDGRRFLDKTEYARYSGVGHVPYQLESPLRSNSRNSAPTARRQKTAVSAGE
jgi:UDPglucose 6-dehydrogenase/GDP-mannose 6-dehydrogenase